MTNDTRPAGPAVALVGAGPASLIAADLLSRAGAQVHLFDRLPSPARKFLMAGRGGLNLTHSEGEEAFLARYTADEALRAAVTAFPPAALVAYAQGLGQECFVGSSGRVFPASLKASPLLRALLTRLSTQGVSLHTRHDWRGWSGSDLVFVTSQGEEREQAEATLLALGGASWPKLGTDGGWAPLLAARGVALAPFQASNCGLIMDWTPHMARFAGAPVKALALTAAGKRFRGEAVITAQGLEGGLIYAAGAALRAGETPSFTLDLCPDRDEAALAEALARSKSGASQSTRLAKAARLSPPAIALAREAGPLPADPAGLAARLKNLPFTAQGFAGLERAISTAGGVMLSGLNADFSLRADNSVFVAGEMLDFDAPTGGYLLQAAFASGVAAARGIAARLGLPALPQWTGPFAVTTGSSALFP